MVEQCPCTVSLSYPNVSHSVCEAIGLESARQISCWWVFFLLLNRIRERLTGPALRHQCNPAEWRQRHPGDLQHHQQHKVAGPEVPTTGLWYPDTHSWCAAQTRRGKTQHQTSCELYSSTVVFYFYHWCHESKEILICQCMRVSDLFH